MLVAGWRRQLLLRTSSPPVASCRLQSAVALSLGGSKRSRREAPPAILAGAMFVAHAASPTIWSRAPTTGSDSILALSHGDSPLHCSDVEDNCNNEDVGSHVAPLAVDL